MIVAPLWLPELIGIGSSDATPRELRRKWTEQVEPIGGDIVIRFWLEFAVNVEPLVQPQTTSVTSASNVTGRGSSNLCMESISNEDPLHNR